MLIKRGPMLKNLWQFIKFSIIGLSNTLISFFVYYVFVFIDAKYYLIGNTAGFIVSTLNSYFWNYRLVFDKSSQSHLRGVVKMYLTYGLTYLINTALLYTFVDKLSISEKISPIIAAVILTPINFLINKLWTFRKEERGG